MIAFDAHVVDRHDVRMGQPGQRLGLDQRGFAFLDGYVDELERDAAVELGIIRGIHYAHAACAETLADAEAAEPAVGALVAEQRAEDARSRQRRTYRRLRSYLGHQLVGGVYRPVRHICWRTVGVGPRRLAIGIRPADLPGESHRASCNLHAWPILPLRFIRSR